MVGGKALRSDPIIRDRIATLAADIEVARQFQMRNSRLVEQGKVPIHEAAMGKVFTSELQERLGQAALDILGTGGLLSEDAASAPVSDMEQVLRNSIMGATFLSSTAVLLIIGVLTSMFTAVTVTRTVLRLVVRQESVRRAAFFGVTEDEFAMRPPNARGRSGEAGRV